jgi:hypothetical protein
MKLMSENLRSVVRNRGGYLFGNVLLREVFTLTSQRSNKKCLSWLMLCVVSVNTSLSSTTSAAVLSGFSLSEVLPLMEGSALRCRGLTTNAADALDRIALCGTHDAPLILFS